MYPPLVIVLLVISFTLGIVLKDTLQIKVGKLSSRMAVTPLSLSQAKRKWNLEPSDFAYLDRCMKNNEEIDIVYLAVPDRDKHLYNKGVYQIESSGRKFYGSRWDKASTRGKSDLLNQFIDAMGLLAEDYIQSKNGLNSTLEANRKKHARKLGSRLEAYNLSKDISASSADSDWNKRYDSIESGKD